MSSDDERTSLADDLAARSDDALVSLLIDRPDLAAPPPQGAAVLAQRAMASASIALAGENLDLLAVAVLEQVLTLGTSSDNPGTVVPVSAKAIAAGLAGRAGKREITARIDLLIRRALLWGPREALMFPAHAPSAMPWRAMHLTGPLADRSPDDLRAEIDALDERPRELLRTLSQGPALGRSRDASVDADPSAPIPRLIAAGLLARIDEQTVELPPMVGQLIRDEPPLRTDDLRAPDPSAPAGGGRRFSADEVEAAAGGEALELIRHATTLLRVLGVTPAAVLRSGALGVREQRRLAKVSGLTPERVALVVELLAALHLIDAGFPDPPPVGDTGEQSFAPTHAADAWLHQGPDRQWAALLTAWLNLPRRPWQVGTPDRDGNARPVLSDDLLDAYSVLQRREILTALAGVGLTPLAVGTPVDVDRLCTALVWRHPRQLRRFGREAVTATLTEARAVGAVAHGALTAVGHALLFPPAAADEDAGTESDAALLTAMDAALPTPVDHFLAQADLTLMVPGPMTPELADQVELVADLESGGAASVYRVTEDTVRRALDAGRSSSELVAMFTTHSRTPVPQALTYLIEDVGRRHGQLRVGVASAFVRCEDATTLAAVLRSDAAEKLMLRALAPTVAVSPADVRDVIDALRAAGFAPSGEDSSGSLVDLRDRGSRVTPLRSPRNTPVSPRSPRRHASSEQMAGIIARMRAADRAGAAHAGPAPARATGGGMSATALIGLAIGAGRLLRIGYVDAHGSASRHVVVPATVGAGQLRAREVGSDVEQQFSLHRITSVEMLDSPDTTTRATRGASSKSAASRGRRTR